MISSLLKWGFLGLLVLMAPLLAIPVGIYIGWRLGLLKQFRKVLGGSLSSLRIRERIFRINASYSKSLRETTVGCRYYIPCGDSPFALFRELGGYRCVSAFTIRDTSASAANYGKAVNEAARVLSNCSSRVVVTLDISRGSEVGCMIQVEEPCVKGGDGWFKALGDGIIEREGLLMDAVQSISPSLKVKVCRGREILQGPFMEEGCQ